MGFSAIPPRPDLALLVSTINAWTPHADMALILTEPPWDSLLAGRPPDALIRANQLGLADYYRSKNLRVVVSIDPTNGLDRSSDSAPLKAAGRSLTEPAIQQMFRDYAVAMDTLVHPDFLGLGSETNLVRLAAPAALYAAEVQAANDAATDIHSYDPQAKLFTTAQVEVAWGQLGSTSTGYVGIARDRADFAFDAILGLSSYPYLGGFVEPEDVPLDYYSRLVEGAAIPEMVIEGGWTSVSLGAIASSPDKQRRYIARQIRILDKAQAIGVFQITFTDLDLAAWPAPSGSLAPFAYLGLVDKDFVAKPALSEWDRAFRRPGP
ncbi:MAG TPA: hypothetical protein VKF80_05220 [Candidatus Eisenbacteria bacterium]|nr:hypothetical protein [Candidatus Eisenbacteria bacterium]